MSTNIKAITGLQNLPNLGSFDADFTSLETVDFSGLTNLTYVDISDTYINGTEGENALTSFNITGCTALEELYVDDSDFSEGGFPSLTSLTNLQRIDADQSSITTPVNLANSPNLTYVDFGGNTGLTSLTIGEQQISYFNASNCALTETAVNNILIALDENGIENGEVYLDSGTNSHPTGDGAGARIQLVQKGWTVETNTAPGGRAVIAASTDFDIIGDFTIEMFVNLNNTDSPFPRLYSFGTHPAANAISIENGTAYFWANNGQTLSGVYDANVGEWHHIAMMGSGSTVYMLLDGQMITSDDYSGTISSQALPLTIGYGNESGSDYNGLMSNFRWTNSAVYDIAGYTVPTAPLTALADTVLLTFQGDDLTQVTTDNSASEHVITATGATYSATGPFEGSNDGSIQMGYA